MVVCWSLPQHNNNNNSRIWNKRLRRRSVCSAQLFSNGQYKFHRNLTRSVGQSSSYVALQYVGWRKELTQTRQGSQRLHYTEECVLNGCTVHVLWCADDIIVAEL